MTTEIASFSGHDGVVTTASMFFGKVRRYAVFLAHWNHRWITGINNIWSSTIRRIKLNSRSVFKFSTIIDPNLSLV